MRSCLYEGKVLHSRSVPFRHSFRYSLFMMYIDLSELGEIFRGRWLWSVGRRNVAAFHRADYLGPAREPLDDAVRSRVEAETGVRPSGPIRMLTHLRYFGYCMNPVTFYYCFDRDGEALDFVVAEITNTPWGERFAYVLDHRSHRLEDGRLEASFDKRFHVSPFWPMKQRYEWVFPVPSRELRVEMKNLEGEGGVFHASLSLQRKEISAGSLASALLRYPFMTGRVVAGIYWQAFRLWLRRAPFHSHPKHRDLEEGSPS